MSLSHAHVHANARAEHRNDERIHNQDRRTGVKANEPLRGRNAPAPSSPFLSAEK